MTRYLAATVALLFFAVGAVGAVHAGEPNHHQHQTASAHELRLDNGKRWETDEALRESMAGIRGLMAARLDAIHADTLDADGYEAIATGVEQQVNRIVQTCKLPPDADAELHKLVAQMMVGVQQMRDGPMHRDGAVTVVKALRSYGEYFAHEGWQPLVH